MITNTLMIALVAVGAFFIFASKAKGPQKWSNLFNNTVSAYTGKTVYTEWKSNNNLGAPAYVNDYQASTTYAESYDNEQMGQDTSLVNSTTFVNAKDKKAKAVKAKMLKAIAALKESRARDNKLSDTNSASSNNNVAGGGFGAINAKKIEKKEEEENLNTFEYWEDPIFVKVDGSAVMKLIESFQVQKVSSGVFYEVVNEMTQDERTQVREFGLLSLQATPSAKSFTYLAVMKNTDVNTDLRIAAEAEVASYADAGRLGYAVSSLKPQASENSTRITLEAIKVVAVATKNYTDLSESGTGGEVPRTNGSTVGLETKLTQAYNILSTVAQTDDATVKTEAEKTMESISKVITI